MIEPAVLLRHGRCSRSSGAAGSSGHDVPDLLLVLPAGAGPYQELLTHLQRPRWQPLQEPA